MIPRLSTTAQSFKVNQGLVAGAIKDLSEDSIRARVGDDKANSMLWIVGHLVQSRYNLFNLIGGDEKWEYGEIFARGASVHPDGDYPSLEVINEAWEQISQKVYERMEQLSDADIDAELEAGYPALEKNVLHGMAFLGLHESYHAGQLAYIRRLHGGDQLVG